MASFKLHDSMSSKISISHGWKVLRFMVPRKRSLTSLLNLPRTASLSRVSTGIPKILIGGSSNNLDPIGGGKSATPGGQHAASRHQGRLVPKLNMHDNRKREPFS